MAKKPVNLDPYRDLFIGGAPPEHIAEVSGASLAEVNAYADTLKPMAATPPPATPKAEPVPDEPTGDVDTNDLHDPPVNDDREDLLTVIGALQSEVRAQSKRADDAEARVGRLEADLSAMRRDFLAGLASIKANQTTGAPLQERGGCPTVVKVVCDSVTIPGQNGGVHPFKRGDVASVGINGEYVVAALWSRGPKVCVAYGV